MGDMDGGGEPEVLASGRDRPGAYERWSALPPRLRRTGLTVAGLALLAAATGYALAAQPHETPPQPRPPAPSPTAKPVPYPAQAIRITFTRLVLVPGDSGRRTFTIELHAAATSSLAVLRVTQSYESVDLRLAQQTPVGITPGSPRTLVLRARVVDCNTVPLRARSPFLDVTLRNTRARQDLSVIPGDRYAHALTHAFRTLCAPSRPAPGTNP